MRQYGGLYKRGQLTRRYAGWPSQSQQVVMAGFHVLVRTGFGALHGYGRFLSLSEFHSQHHTISLKLTYFGATHCAPRWPVKCIM